MKKHLLPIIGVLVLSVLACSLGGSGGTETQAPSSNILFQDDFSSANTGWEVGDYDTGAVGYGDGYYFVTSENSGDIMWGLAGKNLNDLVIEIDATQVQGPGNDNNAYGVGCRFTSSDQPDGYLFRISGDGYYAIHMITGGEATDLVDWTESSIIRKGDATNNIRVTCNGTSLTLEVNGELLASATDSTYTSGDIVLAATTYEDEMTEIHFDSIVASEP